jgi:hypothetical protein
MSDYRVETQVEGDATRTTRNPPLQAGERVEVMIYSRTDEDNRIAASAA